MRTDHASVPIFELKSSRIISVMDISGHNFVLVFPSDEKLNVIGYLLNKLTQLNVVLALKRGINE